MALFKPYMMLNRLTDLTPEMLEKAGVKGLLLDVDNTLSRHFDKVPFDGVTEFVKEMRQKGIKLIVLSNSPKSRVAPFAKKLSLDFECDAKKPLCGGAKRAAARMGLRKNQVMLCGDQLFTDMLCGNLWGIKTLLVTPAHAEDKLGFKIKRFFEKPFLARYEKHKGDDIL